MRPVIAEPGAEVNGFRAAQAVQLPPFAEGRCDRDKADSATKHGQARRGSRYNGAR